MNLYRARASMVGALLGVSAIAACGGSSSIEVSPQTKEAILALSASQPHELRVATGKVIAECMRNKGFDYQPNSPMDPTSQSHEQSENLAGIGGLMEERDADSVGYGGQTPNPNSSATEGRESLEPPSAEYMLALTGNPMTSPTGPPEGEVRVEIDGQVFGTLGAGCVGEGWTRIYGSPENYLRRAYLPQGLLKFSQDIQDDDQVTNAFERYGSCMAAAGYRGIRGLKDARDQARERFSRSADEPPSAEERAMAVSDARCQSSSGLRDVLDEAMLRAGAQWIIEHESDLITLAEQQRESLRRAKQIIEG